MEMEEGRGREIMPGCKNKSDAKPRWVKRRNEQNV
jgi:hypothetical protein